MISTVQWSGDGIIDIRRGGEKFLTTKMSGIRYRVFHLTGPSQKVLCVEDGKIPTKKVKAEVSHREKARFSLFWYYQDP